MNIHEILKFKRPKESFYDIIGCDQSSSIEQINKEYKIRALQLHPDKNQNTESLEEFRKLQAAKDVLSDRTSRIAYDSWLGNQINIPFEQWRNMRSHTMHWATAKLNKLSIQESGSIGQGSELKQKDDVANSDSEVNITQTKHIMLKGLDLDIPNTILLI